MVKVREMKTDVVKDEIRSSDQRERPVKRTG
jgi:hypothetical protein